MNINININKIKIKIKGCNYWLTNIISDINRIYCSLW